MVIALYTIVVQKVVMLFIVVLCELVETIEDGLLLGAGDVDGGVDGGLLWQDVVGDFDDEIESLCRVSDAGHVGMEESRLDIVAELLEEFFLDDLGCLVGCACLAAAYFLMSFLECHIVAWLTDKTLGQR